MDVIANYAYPTSTIAFQCILPNATYHTEKLNNIYNTYLISHMFMQMLLIYQDTQH